MKKLVKIKVFVITILIFQSISSVKSYGGTDTKLFFGDTHLHTYYSFDAFLNNNHSIGPDAAYRWAKGQPVIHPFNRTRVQINTPLDFLVIADHAEMMGVMKSIRDDTFLGEDLGIIGNLKRWYAFRSMNQAVDEGTGLAFFRQFVPQNPNFEGHPDPVKLPGNNISDLAIFGDTEMTVKRTWLDLVDSADEHNDPEKFTTLIGWEWSSLPMGVNLHRVIISPDGGDIAKSYIPFGSDQSQYPQKLWEWLEDTSNKTGAEFIAIPHNSNISKGYMFDRTTLEGDQITASYAKTRLAWEPIVEVTQIKGDSETHSKLSPNDDFADFENYEYHIQVGKSKYIPQEADFVRPALKVGLEIEKSVGVNPYKFGLIGSTDSHSGLSSPEESNFLGKFATDSTPETKKRLGSRLSANGWDMSASGLAAVWAENNTRDEIFNAFKRREVYATTGSRIKVQVFAGWLFPEGAENANNFSEIGYKYGVPMGGELTSTPDSQASLSLLIRAAKDPIGANLDRIQVVKGWIDKENQTRERVFDVAWSEDRVNLENDRIAPIQSTVDLTSGRYENSVGEDSFAVLWTDPDFTPADKSFYYVRVLEIPTPRNGLLDSIALGLDKPPRGTSIIQERAYSSPIWYHPK